MQLNHQHPLQFSVILQKINTKITVHHVQVLLRILTLKIILQECVYSSFFF